MMYKVEFDGRDRRTISAENDFEALDLARSKAEDEGAAIYRVQRLDEDGDPVGPVMSGRIEAPGYLEVLRYSRPFMDEIRGCFHIKNIFRANRVARVTAGCACRLPLRHDYVVELTDGQRVCADRYRWLEQPDPDERYGDWV